MPTEDHHIQINDAGIEAMGKDPNGPIGQLVEKKCYETMALARMFMKIPGSGRIYYPGEYFLRRGPKLYHWKRSTEHQASAPGEPASSDTGLASVSIYHRLEVKNGVITGTVVGGVKYFYYFEVGTRFMEPRPVLRPALHAAMRT